ncbi:hypothetical protein NV379_07920 [Paenibacillus sp. N1-5-1-14]|uniref:hypothetical protein n=1 Tax=Paenibacillus radicibacter TaxID=2972488 RepID=UPI002159AC14|nr:hypothetical protein [Paenibacillus radicibacter]MCR8642588.1 hypothetical protein [Paenibacillus radicibacter]
MPDWSYQTIFRPLLFRLPARVARGVTLRAMRTVSQIPGGTFVIKTLGHMEPAPILETDILGTTFPTPVGLSGAVDPDGTAVQAISQFGFGFVEIGPVTLHPIRSATAIQMKRQEESITYPSEFENCGLDEALHRIRKPNHRLPQLIRIASMPEVDTVQAISEMQTMMDILADEKGITAIVIEAISQDRSTAENEQVIALLTKYAKANQMKPILLYIPLNYPESLLEPILQGVDPEAWSGFVIGDRIANIHGVTVGKDGKLPCKSKLPFIRSHAKGKPLLFASAGVHEPADALELVNAGADYVMLHSGLIYAGPGLPKRVNEAIIYQKLKSAYPPPEQSFLKNWGWMCLLGIGMMIGGFIAWWIAVSTVLLPYDEAFLGMTREELHVINGHLLHFMSHDRITLAGTMLSIGIIYYQLARYGVKMGQHWAKTAVNASGAIGFPSFLLYLGYGFFDPLHAGAVAILLPMFLLSLRNNPDRLNRKPVNLHNNAVWRKALWGQLIFVFLGVGLCIGGITIAIVGITEVFVPQDLSFLGMTRDSIDRINPRLIPLIAHDRAGFGGALLADGVMVLIMSLWGIQQGAKWQWWTLLLGGAPGFIAGLSVHFDIGYTDFIHLSPAYLGCALYIVALILLYPYLMRSHKG